MHRAGDAMAVGRDPDLPSADEYVAQALEHLNAIYKSSALVANICVYVTKDTPQPIAHIGLHKSNPAHASGSWMSRSTSSARTRARTRKASTHTSPHTPTPSPSSSRTNMSNLAYALGILDTRSSVWTRPTSASTPAQTLYSPSPVIDPHKSDLKTPWGF
ncbi:hypothetical protein BJ912DRAFT_1141564 [Pholiota molesta]|nr:hypothetical protein BJ912DRAFT_1141564 [Pholiota molesta]